MLKGKRREIFNDILIVVGVVLMAFSYAFFFVGHKIAPGGLTGVATLLYYLFGWPIGTTLLVLNVPLFALSMRLLGLRFGLKSFLSMVGLSLLLMVLPTKPIIDDLFMASIYGGCVLGIGLGLVLHGGATTGGTDLIAKLLHHRFPSLRVGWILFAVDAVVIIATAVEFDTTLALYALVALYLSARVLDLIQDGFTGSKMLLIISTQPQRIAERIMDELSRGVTGLNGQGMYSGTERQVLLCVVYRTEISTVKAIVSDEDHTAFVIVSDVGEAMGEGFSHVQPPNKKKKKKQIA